MGIVLLSLFFPADKLGRFVSKQLSDSMGRTVRIESVVLRPWGRLDIQNVTLGFTEEEGIDKGTLLSLDRLTIRYRIFSLLRRRLDITGVSVEGPKLHVIALPLEGRERIDQKKDEKEKAAAGPLPVSLVLKGLDLKDFDFAMTLPDTSGERELAISGVHLEVSDVRVPRDYLTEPERIRGRIGLFTRDSEVRFKDPAMSLRTAVEMELNIQWGEDSRWNLDGKLTLRRLGDPADSGAGLDIEMSGEGFGNKIDIGKADVRLGDRRILKMTGHVDRLMEGAPFHLTLGSDSLHVQDLVKTLKDVLPDTLTAALVPMRVYGIIHPVKGNVSGDTSRIRFRVRSEIRQGRFKNPDEGWVLKDGSVAVEVSGSWFENRLVGGQVLGQAEANSFDYDVNDSVTVSAEGFFLRLDSELDHAFIPVQGSLDGGVADLLDGSLGMHFAWHPSQGSGDWTENMIVDGRLRADSLRIESFPGGSPELTGKIDLSGDLKGNGIKDIRLHLLGRSPGVTYPYGEGAETTPPLRLESDIALHGDSLLQEWVIDSASVRMDDILSGRFSGYFSATQGRFRLNLEQGSFDNKEIPTYFPPILKEELEGITLWGREVFTGRIAGETVGDSVAVSVEGRVQFDDVGLDHPFQRLKVEGLEGDIRFAGDPASISGNVQMVVRRAFLETLRPQPFLDSRLTFDWHMIPQDSLWIDSGKIELKPFGLEGDFFLGLGQMAQEPRIAGDAEIRFRAFDSLRVAQDTWIAGSMTCLLHGETLDLEKQYFRLGGELRIETLDAGVKGLFSLNKLRGRMPFQIDADQKNMRLVLHPERRPPSWVEYESQRAIIRSLSPEIGHVRADAIEVAGYRLSDLTFDVNVHDGYVQVPWFNMNVLEGNFGGSIFINLKEGDKRDIAYEIRAQASRINSAALANVDIEDEEETELNASMAFQGRGIDLVQGIDLQGFFHITKIGPKFASTLLQGMDPRGEDRSIRLTRRFLNSGWKPTLFSFELRHSHVYPSLLLDQPWFSPIRIPERLEYGRIPLEFFLKPKKQSE